MDSAYKALFEYKHHDGIGVGYEFKQKIGDTFDHKEDIHLTLAGLPRLRSVADDLGAAHGFLSAGESLILKIESAVVQYAHAIQNEHCVTGLVSEVLAGKDRWILRFLHYFGNRTAGDEIASAHADKSGFTLYLHESSPGVQWLDENLQWKDMSLPRFQLVAMPGMQLQYRTEGSTKATYHRVVATESTARDGRYSIVCFVPFINTPSYDKRRAGRLQDAAVGFNYSMPFEEFSKLFV